LSAALVLVIALSQPATSLIGDHLPVKVSGEEEGVGPIYGEREKKGSNRFFGTN